MKREKNPESIHETPWMTMHQLAKYLQIDYRTVYRYKKDYGLPCSKMGGIYRFHRETIDAWLMTPLEERNPVQKAKTTRRRKPQRPRVVKPEEQQANTR